MSIKYISMKTFTRIILSPIIYIGYLLLCIGGLIFPTSIIMLFSFYLFFGCIGADILNLVLEKKIHIDDGFFIYKNKYITHLLGITLIIWIPIYASYIFIKQGKLIG